MKIKLIFLLETLPSQRRIDITPQNEAKEEIFFFK